MIVIVLVGILALCSNLFASAEVPLVLQPTDADGEAVNAPGGIVSSRVPPLNIDAGFLFLNGSYVDSPYKITFSDTEISLNGNSVPLSEFEVWKNDKRLKSGESRSHFQQVRRQLRLLFKGNGSLILFDGEPLQAFHRNDSYDLLKALVNPDARSEFVKGHRDWLPQSVNWPLWNNWIDGFDCPESLSRRANEVVSPIDQVLNEHEAIITARSLLETSTYPLNIAGMLLVALASGHLLAHRPGPSADEANAHFAGTNVTRSVLLIAALSSLDLVWTVLVSRTGDMKELNPLGAALITNPPALIAMKFVATALAVSILYCLRHHRIAQQGAWWAALICTLLTVRWLTFHSMFV